MSEKTQAQTATTKPAKPAKPAKPVNHEIIITVKAPGDMSASRVQRALQKVFDEGRSNIEVSGGGDAEAEAKVIEDLDRLTIGKVKVARKAPAPA